MKFWLSFILLSFIYSFLLAIKIHFNEPPTNTAVLLICLFHRKKKKPVSQAVKHYLVRICHGMCVCGSVCTLSGGACCSLFITYEMSFSLQTDLPVSGGV